MSSVIRLASSLLILSSGVICAQTAPATIESALVGKEVVLKIDLPGSQKGVDLRFNKDSPMDWKEYDGRLRSFGVALRKGDTARITAIVRKSDLIEVQLDGGGFGTVRDDTTTTVTAKKIEKSDYEKRLEEEIASTTDDDKRRDLQRDLDRERSRRDRENSANERDAKYASIEKGQKVDDQRSRGGSRINLRWSGSAPEDLATPEGVLARLTAYLTLRSDGSFQMAPSAELSGSMGPQIRKGMTFADVSAQLGTGRLLSESVSAEGLKTESMQYATKTQAITVTFVNSIVVRFNVDPI